MLLMIERNLPKITHKVIWVRPIVRWTPPRESARYPGKIAPGLPGGFGLGTSP